MKYRKLRIAWSVAWGLVLLLVIALWIRSHSWADTFLYQITTTRAIQLNSVQGVGSIESLYFFQPADAFESEFDSEPVSGESLDSSPTGFAWEVARGADGGSHTLSLPYWFPLLLSAAFAAIPWIRWRFRLRTLLIATMLVAVLLGLIVWLR